MAKIVWTGTWDSTEENESELGYGVKPVRVRLVETGGRLDLERFDGVDRVGGERWRDGSLAEFFVHGGPLKSLAFLQAQVDKLAPELASARERIAGLQDDLVKAHQALEAREARTAVPPPRTPRIDDALFEGCNPPPVLGEEKL